MLRNLFIALLLLTPALSRAAETVQFDVELGLSGCKETDQVSNCDGSKESTKESISFELACAEERNGECSFSVGRASREYVLHWSERNLKRTVKVMLIVSKIAKSTKGKPKYSFSMALYPANARNENETNNALVGVSDFNALDSVSLSAKVERKPIGNGAFQTLWPWARAANFLAFPGR